MDRNFEYTKVAGPVTSGGSVTLVTHIPTGYTAGERMLFLSTVQAITDGSAFNISINASSPEFDHYITPVDVASEFYSCPMFFPKIASGFVGEEFKIDGIPDSGTITMRQGFVGTFKLCDLDEVNDVFGSSTTSDTTYQDVTNSSKPFTVPADGDYLILACASVRKDETTANFNIVLDVDGTEYGEATFRANSTTKYIPWATGKKVTLTAGPHTMKLKHKVVTTGSVSTNYGTVVAMRCRMLPVVFEDEDLADDSTSSTTYVDKLSLSVRTQAQPTLIISLGLYRRFSANEASMRTRYDGVDIAESLNQGSAVDDESVHCALDGVTPTAAGDHILLQQFRRESDGISVAKADDAVLAVITMKDNVTVQILGGQIHKGQIL